MTKQKISTFAIIGMLVAGLLLLASCTTLPASTTTTGIYVSTTTGTSTSLTTGVITSLPATTTGMVTVTTTGTTLVTTTGTAAVPADFWSQYGIIIFIIVIFGLMYLLMIRPQRKRQKDQQRMMGDLKRGDQIITTAGIYGTIDSVEETSYVIKLESGATIRVVERCHRQ